MNLEQKFLSAASAELDGDPIEFDFSQPMIKDPEQFSATATKREGGVGFVEGTAPSAVSGGATAPTNLTPSGKVAQPAPKQLTQDDVNKMIADPARHEKIYTVIAAAIVRQPKDFMMDDV